VKIEKKVVLDVIRNQNSVFDIRSNLHLPVTSSAVDELYLDPVETEVEFQY